MQGGTTSYPMEHPGHRGGGRGRCKDDWGEGGALPSSASQTMGDNPLAGQEIELKSHEINFKGHDGNFFNTLEEKLVLSFTRYNS